MIIADPLLTMRELMRVIGACEGITSGARIIGGTSTACTHSFGTSSPRIASETRWIDLKTCRKTGKLNRKPPCSVFSSISTSM